MGWFDFETDNFPVVLLLAISAFRGERDGFCSPLRQNKRRSLRIDGTKKVTEISSTLAAMLASNFQNRVVCDGPVHGSCSCVYMAHISKISHLLCFLGEK